MDERLRFVARLLKGEKMAPLCAEFGIARRHSDRTHHAPASPNRTADTSACISR